MAGTAMGGKTIDAIAIRTSATDILVLGLDGTWLKMVKLDYETLDFVERKWQNGGCSSDPMEVCVTDVSSAESRWNDAAGSSTSSPDAYKVITTNLQECPVGKIHFCKTG